MKLTGQAEQYWENLKRMMWFRRNDLVETWKGMKETYVEIHSTFLLPTVTRQMEKVNSRKQVGH